MKLASIVTTTVAAAGLALANLAGVASATNLTGAGATFPFPIYAKWAEGYQKASGSNINYQSIGSGGGIIKRIKTYPNIVCTGLVII